MLSRGAVFKSGKECGLPVDRLRAVPLRGQRTRSGYLLRLLSHVRPPAPPPPSAPPLSVPPSSPAAVLGGAATGHPDLLHRQVSLSMSYEVP